MYVCTFAFDAYANMSFLNHRHVISSISYDIANICMYVWLYVIK